MIHEKLQPYIPQGASVHMCGRVASFEVPTSDLERVVRDLISHEALSFTCITATDERADHGCFRIWYVIGMPRENLFIVPFIQLKQRTEFPTLSHLIRGAVYDERKIRTFFGLTPTGCLDARPIILHENWPVDAFPLRKDFSWKTRPEIAKGTYRFQEVLGEGIYEIPVGPIHAGIIEPGHFRFSVAGERIVFLEPRLGFTHKGSEKLFEVLSLKNKVRLSEKISGDSSFSHSLALCQALEQLSEIVIPDRARYLRVMYAELERLANHFGDLGAIMMDAGFNFGGAQGSRLREMVMQIQDRITGSRFLRGVNMVGGVTRDIDEKEKQRLAVELENLRKDFSEVRAVAESSTSLLNRLKGTGVLSVETVKNHGVLGVAGKSAGFAHDARVDYPYAAYGELSMGEVVIERGGDVYARFCVRAGEVEASINLIQEVLHKLPNGCVHVPQPHPSFKKDAMTISVVEGWRGEIVYFVTTDADGNISRVAPRDPSAVNWAVMSNVAFDNVIPDFPLINKSFNLSYSGNDL